MSSLPIAQFCGMSPKLDLGAGRAAAMSSAFHSKCANQPNAADLWNRLTVDEQATVETWKRPDDVFVNIGEKTGNWAEIRLKYDAAEKEVEVALDKHAGFVEATDPSAESVGHLDMAWVVNATGHRIAYVGDIKKSEFTSTVDSLQLAAYGFAWAAKEDCDVFCTGIWAATEGRWTWGDLVYLEKQEALDLWERILAAARNTSDEYSEGPHCKGCFSRNRCPMWSLPPSQLAGDLAPLVAGQEITRERLTDVVVAYQKLKDLAEKVGPLLKDAADRLGGAYDPKTDKVWKAVMKRGRESMDRALLEKELGDGAARFLKRGADYPEYR